MSGQEFSFFEEVAESVKKWEKKNFNPEEAMSEVGCGVAIAGIVLTVHVAINLSVIISAMCTHAHDIITCMHVYLIRALFMLEHAWTFFNVTTPLEFTQ